MKISTLVHVSKTLKNLKTPILEFSFREKLFSVFHELVYVEFLKYKRIKSNIEAYVRSLLSLFLSSLPSDGACERVKQGPSFVLPSSHSGMCSCFSL